MSNSPSTSDFSDSSHDGKTVKFKIDAQQYRTDQETHTARQLLADFAGEDPEVTTLALKRGNDFDKYENDDEVISMHNGMKFVVFHDEPTSVS